VERKRTPQVISKRRSGSKGITWMKIYQSSPPSKRGLKTFIQISSPSKNKKEENTKLMR